MGNEKKRSQGKEPRPIFAKEHHETGLVERGNVGFNQGIDVTPKGRQREIGWRLQSWTIRGVWGKGRYREFEAWEGTNLNGTKMPI